MYTYPDFSNSSTVFDYEDLSDDIMIVLCVRANPQDQERAKFNYLFVWKGEYFEELERREEEAFIEKVKEQYWGNARGVQIEVMEEVAGEESEQF